MKKIYTPLYVIVSLLLLVWGWFFASTEAQNISQSEQIENVYAISNPLQHIFSLLQRINPLLQKYSSQHAAAEDVIITIPNETIVRYLDESRDFDQFFRKIRVSIVQSLLNMQYSNFITQPYQDWTNLITVQSWDFTIHTAIETKDMLDTLLTNKLSLFRSDFNQIKKLNKHLEFSAIDVTAQDYQDLWAIFLYKTEQDLRDLWYELISRKSRINTDVEYRRRNISAAFHNIGMVRLLKPGEIFSTLKELHYVPNQWLYNYVEWLVTVGNGATMIYGGGLCGVATALYQWALTNLGLSLIDYSPHSTYYRNLYEAEVNGIMVKDPWLDATIFSPIFDLKLQNIRDYPIIIGFTFDGLSGSQEQVFTLAKPQDRGSFEFIRSYMKWTYSCFTWKINGENRTNCYRHVKNY